MARLDGYSDGLRQLVGMIGIVDDDPASARCATRSSAAADASEARLRQQAVGPDRSAQGPPGGAARRRRATRRRPSTRCGGRSMMVSRATASWCPRPARRSPRPRRLADQAGASGLPRRVGRCKAASVRDRHLHRRAGAADRPAARRWPPGCANSPRAERIGSAVGARERVRYRLGGQPGPQHVHQLLGQVGVGCRRPRLWTCSSTGPTMAIAAISTSRSARSSPRSTPSRSTVVQPAAPRHDHPVEVLGVQVGLADAVDHHPRHDPAGQGVGVPVGQVPQRPSAAVPGCCRSAEADCGKSSFSVASASMTSSRLPGHRR